MKELKSIEEELADCKKAFARVKVGSLVWCCHHEMLIEQLEEPAINRINYIMGSKSEHERSRRLREFRPCKDKRIAPAYAEYEKVRAPAKAEYEKVCAPAKAEYEKVCAPAYAEYEKVCAPAYAEYDKVCDVAYAEYEKVRDVAYAEYDKVCDVAKAELEQLHRDEYPDTSWNGRSIFPAS